LVKRKFTFNINPLKPRRQSLREKSTLAEKILWERLRRNNLGVKFFRQYSVEGYVMDFYCPEKRLSVEIEGSIHNLSSTQKYDKYREKYLQAFGIKILKFSNTEVFTKVGNVTSEIKSALHTPS